MEVESERGVLVVGGVRSELGGGTARLALKTKTWTDSVPFKHLWLTLLLPFVLMLINLSSIRTASGVLSAHIS